MPGKAIQVIIPTGELCGDALEFRNAVLSWPTFFQQLNFKIYFPNVREFASERRHKNIAFAKIH